MSNTNKYFAFIKTVECGSFSKAAEQLNYSQAAVSQMIKDLEHEWGFSLLVRNNVSMNLTSEGQLLLPLVRELCTCEQRLQEQVRELNGLEEGLIRIGVFSSVATHWLPNIISRFNVDYPNVEYELILGYYREIEEWIENGSVDCGFVRTPTDIELETSFLEKDKMMVAMPKDHPLAGRKRFPIKALGSYPFMLLENDDMPDISMLLKEWDIKPDVRLTTWDDHAVLAMIEQGLGIGILPELVLKRIPYSVVIKELELPAYRNIAFAIRDKNSASRAVLAFMDYLTYRNEGL